MKSNPIAPEVGDQVKLRFTTYGKAYETDGELQMITSNCVCVDYRFYNFSIIKIIGATKVKTNKEAA